MKMLSMNLLSKEVIEKSKIDLKNNIKSLKINRDTFLVKKILENQHLFKNKKEKENIDFKEQLRWIENEILNQIKEKGYFDKIYYEFEFRINDEEDRGNTVNYIYYHHIEKILKMLDLSKNDILKIKTMDIGSKEFSFEFIFDKKSILLELEFENDIDISKLEKANIMVLKNNFKYYILESLTEIFANVGMRCVCENYNFSYNRFGKYEFIFRSKKENNKTKLIFFIKNKIKQEIVFTWENTYIKKEYDIYFVNEKEIDISSVYSFQKHLIRNYEDDKKENIDEFIARFFININFEEFYRAIDSIVNDEFNKKYEFEELEKYFFNDKIELKENDKRVEWESEDYFYCFGTKNRNNGEINILGIFSSYYNEFNIDFSENQIGVFKIYKNKFQELKEKEITEINIKTFKDFIVLDNITDKKECYVPYDFLKQFYDIKKEEDIFKTIFKKLDFYFFEVKDEE